MPEKRDELLGMLKAWQKAVNPNIKFGARSSRRPKKGGKKKRDKRK